MELEMKKSFKYQFADSWLLLAIIYAHNQKKSDLASIIAYGDYINHAIFTLEELQGGFFRLFKSGCVLKEKDEYIPSKEIIEFYKNSCSSRKVVMKDLECVQEELRMPDWDSKYDPSQANKDGIYKDITQEVYDKAVVLYKNSL